MRNYFSNFFLIKKETSKNNVRLTENVYADDGQHMEYAYNQQNIDGNYKKTKIVFFSKKKKSYKN